MLWWRDVSLGRAQGAECQQWGQVSHAHTGLAGGSSDISQVHGTQSFSSPRSLQTWLVPSGSMSKWCRFNNPHWNCKALKSCLQIKQGLVGHFCANFTRLRLILEKSHLGKISSWKNPILYLQDPGTKGSMSDKYGQVPNTSTGMCLGETAPHENITQGNSRAFFFSRLQHSEYFLLKAMNSPCSWHTPAASPSTPITPNPLPPPASLLSVRNTAQVRQLCASKIALSLPSWCFWVINTFLEAGGVHQWVFVKCRSEAAIWQSASDTLLRGHFVFQATMSLI